MAATPPAKGASETINGIAIMPGVERLSYVSPRYLGIRKSYDDCMAAAQGQVPSQGECADTEFTFQDARLNKAYKAVMADLASDKIARDAAQDAQRAWLAFFDKDCAARAGRFGSNDAPATLSMCRMESTALRAQQLEDWHGSLSPRK
ncbi:lysozyme inhibitor LprI family protein [Luteibacter sp.]|uniref:lysozyme inhibitor LprI family protein n=1 Tax=Luteibacter sp. TaxID=1886636 RepID=UPI0025C69593|nr:lysozyme inhibitor LprI family protein [Luteibacter sp.]